MKIIADTNFLVRMVIDDDPAQHLAALAAVNNAESVFIGCHALCELVWVLGGRYGYARNALAATLRHLITIPNAVYDDAAMRLGVAVLEAGGDFADGVIAYEGMRVGGDTFVSFDKKAVSLLRKQGYTATLLT